MTGWRAERLAKHEVVVQITFSFPIRLRKRALRDILTRSFCAVAGEEDLQKLSACAMIHY